MTTLLLALLVTTAGAAGDEAIDAALAAAKKVHAEASAAATAELQAAIVAAIKIAADRGDLATVKALDADGKALAADGTLPVSPQVRASVGRYETSLKAAGGRLDAAYAEAIREHTKMLNVDGATALERERASLGTVPATAGWHGKWQATFNAGPTGAHTREVSGNRVVSIEVSTGRRTIGRLAETAKGVAVVEFEDGRVERWTPCVDGRALVERTKKGEAAAYGYAAMARTR
jgi:hypothetical protein